MVSEFRTRNVFAPAYTFEVFNYFNLARHRNSITRGTLKRKEISIIRLLRTNHRTSRQFARTTVALTERTKSQPHALAAPNSDELVYLKKHTRRVAVWLHRPRVTSSDTGVKRRDLWTRDAEKNKELDALGGRFREERNGRAIRSYNRRIKIRQNSTRLP